MTNKTYLLPFLVLFLLFFSLNHAVAQGNEYFISPSGTLLKFQKKKDLLFSIGGTFRESKFRKSSFGKIQIGYSPINHLSVSLFHSRQKLAGDINFENIYHQSQNTGINIGTYYLLNFQLKPRKEGEEQKYLGILFDFATGYSVGKLTNNYYEINIGFNLNNNIGFNELNLRNIYIHSGVHFLFLNKFDVSLSYKIGQVDYHKGQVDRQGFGNIRNQDNILELRNNRFQSFNELSSQIEFKTKYFGIYLKGTLGEVTEFRWEDSQGEVGLTVDIGKFKK